MSALRKFTIRSRLVGLAAVSLIALVVSASVGLWAASRLTTLSQDVFATKDVVADVLPPPLFLIEMRLDISRMFEKTMTPSEAKREVARLVKEHDARVAYWREHPVSGLDVQVLERQYDSSRRFMAAASLSTRPWLPMSTACVTSCRCWTNCSSPTVPPSTRP